jgi:hypothetical protein
VSPLRGCMVSHFMSHRFRGGLRSFVPGGTGEGCAAPAGLGATARTPTHRFRGGLRSFVPGGTDGGHVPPLRGLVLPRELQPTASAVGYDLSSLAGLTGGMCRPCGAWRYRANSNPPLPRWATIFRPWRDWRGDVSPLRGLALPRELQPTASAVGYDLSSLAGLASMCRPCGAVRHCTSCLRVSRPSVLEWRHFSF